MLSPSLPLGSPIQTTYGGTNHYTYLSEGSALNCHLCAVWPNLVHASWEQFVNQLRRGLGKVPRTCIKTVKAWEAKIMKLKEVKVPKKKWPTKPKCTWKQVVISAISLSKLVENVEGEEGECFDLGLDGSSSDSEEEGEDWAWQEIFPMAVLQQWPIKIIPGDRFTPMP